MARQVSMQFGKPGTVSRGAAGSNSGQVVLLGTDTSGNTDQSNFELSDSIQNYSAIFIMVLFNWSSASNISYAASRQVPTAILPDFTDYNINVLRLEATGSNNYELGLYIKYVDDTHILINKSRTSYSFRTLWIYGIR